VSTRQDYYYRCGVCGKKIRETSIVLQCAACLVPLCPGDYHHGFCQVHFDCLSFDDRQKLKDVKKSWLGRLHEQAWKFAERYRFKGGPLPHERRARLRSGAMPLGEITNANIGREEWHPPRELSQKLEHCVACTRPIPRGKVKFCRQCLAPLCGSCIKASVLCPDHFDQLSIETRNRLIARWHVLRKRLSIGVGACIISPAVAGLLLAIGTALGASFSLIAGIAMLAVGLSFGIMIAMLGNEDGMRADILGALKDGGIHVRFSNKEWSIYVCDVCGGLGPAKSHSHGASPYKCKICGKTLCFNCQSGGLCPVHAAAVDDDDKLALARLERTETRMIYVLATWSIGLFASFAIIIFLNDSHLFYLLPVVLFVSIVLILIWAGLEGRKVRIITDGYS
jgi:hypothetical protein